VDVWGCQIPENSGDPVVNMELFPHHGINVGFSIKNEFNIFFADMVNSLFFFA